MFKKISALFVVSVFTMGMAACGGGKADATCEGAASHILDLAKKELDGKKGEEKKLGEAMLKSMGGEMKKAFVKQCKDEKWSKEALQCIVAAKSEKDMDKCKELAEKGKGDKPAEEKAPPVEKKPAAEPPAEDEAEGGDEAEAAEGEGGETE